MAVLVTAAALGVLGLKMTGVAGWLLIGIGVIPVVISSLGGPVGGQPLLAVSVIPVISGVLYVIAARLMERWVSMPDPSTPEPMAGELDRRGHGLDR